MSINNLPKDCSFSLHYSKSDINYPCFMIVRYKGEILHNYGESVEQCFKTAKEWVDSWDG